MYNIIYSYVRLFVCTWFDTLRVTFSHGSTLLGVVYGRKLSTVKTADVFLSACIKFFVIGIKYACSRVAQKRGGVSPFSVLLCFKLSVHSLKVLITCLSTLSHNCTQCLRWHRFVLSQSRTNLARDNIYQIFGLNLLVLCLTWFPACPDFGFGSRAFMVNPGFMKKQAISLVHRVKKSVEANKVWSSSSSSNLQTKESVRTGQSINLNTIQFK